MVTGKSKACLNKRKALMTDYSGAASRYEGEYLDNQMDGLGVYFWCDGT